MKVLIENYRGFNIEFDTIESKFESVVSEEKVKESKSFDAVKKFIDEYLKNNKNFKPFYVLNIPNTYESFEKLKIVGIRKDGRFVYENLKGEKHQLSDHDLEYYMIQTESSINYLKKYKKETYRFKLLKHEHDKKLEEIKNESDIITLTKYKQKICK